MDCLTLGRDVTVNMTLSPSLLTKGRQLGCSEQVISHRRLRLVKLSAVLSMSSVGEGHHYDLCTVVIDY